MRPAAAKLRAWRADAVLFVRECLGIEPDAWQVDVLRAASRGKRKLALKASKGPGKTTVLAWLGWWFLCTRLHPKVVCTSITEDNLRDNLWTEFSKWQKRSPFLKKAFKWNAQRITSVEHPETWWASARTWAKDADATRQSDALAGAHGDSIMFLVDESGGIPDAVVATAEAGLANADKAQGTEALLVIAGNPTDLSGPLYRACTRERDSWWVKEISGDPDDPGRAPRVSIEWAREQIRSHGRDNPWVLVNVFGKFPPAQSNTLIGADLASEASTRIVGPNEIEGAAKILGVDVARQGDDRTVITLRQGLVVFKQRVFRGLSTMQVAGHVANRIQSLSPDAVFIDQTGYGAGVVDRLRELGFDVIGVDNGEAALRDEPKLQNRRVEQWWEMANWMRSGGSIPDDGELISELTAPKYTFESSGKIILESKRDLKKRGLPSPDKADSMALTFAAPVTPREFNLPGIKLEQERDPDPLRPNLGRTDFDPLDEGRW